MVNGLQKIKHVIFVCITVFLALFLSVFFVSISSATFYENKTVSSSSIIGTLISTQTLFGQTYSIDQVNDGQSIISQNLNLNINAESASIVEVKISLSGNTSNAQNVVASHLLPLLSDNAFNLNSNVDFSWNKTIGGSFAKFYLTNSSNTELALVSTQALSILSSDALEFAAGTKAALQEGDQIVIEVVANVIIAKNFNFEGRTLAESISYVEELLYA